MKVTGLNLMNPGPLPLIKYTTLGGGGFGSLSLTLPPRATGSLVNNTANGSVDLTLSVYDFPRWSGTTNGSWNTTTMNWREVNSGNATAYIQGAAGSDSVVFDDLASGTTNVNLLTTLSPASILVKNETKQYTFSGPGKLSGTTGLVKDGASRLIIANTGTNDFSGPVTIAEGTIQVGDGVTAGGGSLGVGPVRNDGAVELNRPDDFGINNVISGAGELVKNNANTVTLLAGNAFDGKVTVNAGTLRLGSATALGDSAVNAGTDVQSGATLDLNGVFVSNEEIRIRGNGVGSNGALINNGAPGSAFGVSSLKLAANASIGGMSRWDIRNVTGGLVGQGFTLTKVGPNEIRLANIGETGLGPIVISQGLLGFEGNTTFGMPAGDMTIGADGTLGLFSRTSALSKAISLQGGRILAGTGTANVLRGLITLAANSTIEVSAGAVLGLSGQMAGSAGFTKTGSGTLRFEQLNGANTYTGQTVVTAGTLGLANANGVSIVGDVFINGGALDVNAPNQFGPNARVTVNPGGTWVSGSAQTINRFTINTAATQSLFALTITDLLSINAGNHDIGNGSQLTTNALNLSNGTNLRIPVNSANSFLNIGAGGLTLAGSSLQFGSPGAAFSAVVNLGGNVNSSGTSALFSVNTAGARTLDLLGGTRNFNVTGGTTTIGVVVANGGITKSGPGTLVLNGNHSYIGATTVNGGTLVANGGISGSTVTVANGGTLRGNGVTGPLTVQSGGTLFSGGDLLPLTAVSLAFANGSNFSIEINGANSDLVTSVGNITLSGTIGLSIAITAPAVDGLTYTLLNSSNGISGYATGARFSYGGNLLEEGERFSVASGLISQEFTISYLADTGKDVVLTAVPEPGSAILLGCALTMLGLRRVRRRGK